MFGIDHPENFVLKLVYLSLTMPLKHLMDDVLPCKQEKWDRYLLEAQKKCSLRIVGYYSGFVTQ